MSADETQTVRQRAGDAVLGVGCTALAVAVHLGGSESVARNLDPGVWSVLMTVLAVGPVVVRRRAPVTVLAATLLGLLLLVATRNTVGTSTIGALVAFYTAVAQGPRRHLWLAVGVMVAGVALGLLLQPVDLSRGGAVATSAMFCAAGVLGYGVRARRERFESDVVAARERAARSAADERAAISRELHDIIGHALSVMVVQAGVAERLLESDPDRARDAVGQIGETGRRSLAEMRQVLGTLREADADPPREPTPGLDQVPALAARVQTAGLPVTVTSTGPRVPLPPALELAAYRVVQEALTNCLKHAGARQARVSLEHSPDALRVRVSDDGVTVSRRVLDGPTTRNGTGHGLAGMRERVTAFGGDLSAGPGPRGGFVVDARFPAAAGGSEVW